MGGVKRMAGQDVESQLREHMLEKARFIKKVPNSNLTESEVMKLKDKATDGIHFLEEKAKSLRGGTNQDLF
ncbi:hypothetical protein [Bacillus paranthracis]|uniref:hypothetical protein n=1 Tax=Bacillus paranthracis TaxID=2026186 RepID=UPI00187A1D13|nr:hypothetical protein [Bacillus paranthracis]